MSKELYEARAKAVHDAREILDRADREKRDLNSEERVQYDRFDAEIDRINDRLAAAEQRAAAKNRPVAPSQLAKDRYGVDVTRIKLGKRLEIDLSGVDNRQVADSLRRRSSPQYKRAFGAYLRGAKADFEKLGLMVGNDPQGGYLATIEFHSELIKFLDDMSTMRQLGKVLPPTNAKSVGALSYDTDYDDADWTAEVPASDLSEDDDARFGAREMTPHALTKLVKTSKKLLSSATMSIESFLAERLAYKFSITENKAFMSGSGSQRPLGVFVASNDGIPTTRDTTCAATTTFTADEVIDLRESVKDQYAQNGTFLASRTFRKMCRKLKDGSGNYLLVENNTGGGPITLLDRPLIVDENAPATFTTGQYVCVFGDFSWYWIQDGMNFEVQRLDELFALRRQVGWIGSKETDAQPVLAEAFGRMKLG